MAGSTRGSVKIEYPAHVKRRSKMMDDQEQYFLRQQENVIDEEKDKSVVYKFFDFFLYAHPDFKHMNPYKKEFPLLIDLLAPQYGQERRDFIFRCYKQYKKKRESVIKESWLANAPETVSIDDFKDI